MKKILVFDSSGAYLAFIKKHFKNEIEVISYEKTNERERHLERYDCVFFILNDETELIDLMYMYTKVNVLFISSNYNKINEKLKQLDNVVVLNFNQTKDVIVKQLRFCLDLSKSFKLDKRLKINKTSADGISVKDGVKISLPTT